MSHPIPRLLPPPVTALRLVLVLGVSPLQAAAPARLPAARLAQLKAQLPARVAQAQAQLLGLGGQLGLSSQTGFVARDPLTNEQGRAVIHFRQTHQGRRVWGAEAIAHVEAEGTVTVLPATVKAGITLSGAPRLSAEQAQAIALADLAPASGAPDRPPVVEAVAFPVQHMSGTVLTRNSQGHPVLDLKMTLATPRPAEPYVWAYEVKTYLANAQDGFQQLCYIVDGNTGGILRKWNDLRADQPAMATGQSLYGGVVSYTDTLTSQGTYLMIDPTRGSQPYPGSIFNELNFLGTAVLGLSIRYPGWYLGTARPDYGPMWSQASIPYGLTYANTSNTWGDGLDFPFTPMLGGTLQNYWNPYGNANFLAINGVDTPQGETAAVDAMYGMSAAWDLYKNVFGRAGIDNLDSTTFGLVHPYWFNNNAYWSPSDYAMFFGDGTYPSNPGAFRDLTEIDVTGHEMGHGVIQFTANMVYGTSGESAGLDEGTADIFGQLTKAYGRRQDPAAVTIPDFARGDLDAWKMALQAGAGVPIRFMYKPSLDQLSHDMWYEGIGVQDSHYVMGPVGRMFYFLCEGATTDAASVTYSPYLPQGMSGIGIDAAGRIWYKALTEYFPSEMTFDAARQGALQAALAVYGPGSPELAAVMNAFAAINVGAAAGQPEPIRVTFPAIAGAPLLVTVPFVPREAQVVLQAQVLNTTNQALTWSFDTDPTDSWTANAPGVLKADGSWLTPQSGSFLFVFLDAHSQADPLRFARTPALVADLDADDDAEQDALDLGMVAMEWGLGMTPHPSARIVGGLQVSDLDVAFFRQAFLTAWAAK